MWVSSFDHMFLILKLYNITENKNIKLYYCITITTTTTSTTTTTVTTTTTTITTTPPFTPTTNIITITTTVTTVTTTYTSSTLVLVFYYYFSTSSTGILHKDHRVRYAPSRSRGKYVLEMVAKTDLLMLNVGNKTTLECLRYMETMPDISLAFKDTTIMN